MSSSEIEKLQNIFPKLDRDVIVSVLHSSGNKVEEAADKLISLNENPLNDITPSEPRLKTNEGLPPVNSLSSPWLLSHADINNPNSKTSSSHDQHPVTQSRFQTSWSHDQHAVAQSQFQTSWSHDQHPVTQSRFQTGWSHNQRPVSHSHVFEPRSDHWPNLQPSLNQWPTFHQGSSPRQPRPSYHHDRITVSSSPDNQLTRKINRDEMVSNKDSMDQSGQRKDENDKQEKKLMMLRGLPGSGKTTLAKQLCGENGVICSTDDFFIENGRYIFDPMKLSENHEKNKEKATQAMVEGKTPVIIDNTNTTSREMKPYVAMARELKYQIEFIEPDTSWKFDVDRLERLNSHGVAKESLERMLDRYEYDVTVDGVLSSQSLPKHSNRPTRWDETYSRHQYGYRDRQYGYRDRQYGYRDRQYQHSSSQPRFQSQNYRTHPRYSDPHSESYSHSESHSHAELQPQPRSHSKTHSNSQVPSYDSNQGLRSPGTHPSKKVKNFHNNTNNSGSHDLSGVLVPFQQTSHAHENSQIKSNVSMATNLLATDKRIQPLHEERSFEKDKLEHIFGSEMNNSNEPSVSQSWPEIPSSETLNAMLQLGISNRDDSNITSVPHPVIDLTDQYHQVYTVSSLEKKLFSVDSEEEKEKEEEEIQKEEDEGEKKEEEEEEDEEEEEEEEKKEEEEEIQKAEDEGEKKEEEEEEDEEDEEEEEENMEDTIIDTSVNEITNTPLSVNLKTDDLSTFDEDDDIVVVEDDDDMNFLCECFPSFTRAVLELLYQKSQKNLSATIDLALLVPVTDESSISTYSEDLTHFIDDTLINQPQRTDSSGAQSSNPPGSLDVSFEDLYSDTSDDEPMREGDVEVNQDDGGRDMVEFFPGELGFTDEEYAKMLQEQLKFEDGQIQERIEPQTISSQPDIRVNQYHDSNLELTLTPSLAKQLQRMFGSINPYLPSGDELCDEDLVVLLSETAAKEIYKKWVDTLQARNIEYQVLTQQTETSSTSQIGTSKVKKRRRKKKNSNRMRVASAPVIPSTQTKDKGNEQNTLNQQLAEKLGQHEVELLIEKERNERMGFGLKLDCLYRVFPTLSKEVIHFNLHKARFDFNSAQALLANLAPVTKSHDSHTIYKPLFTHKPMQKRKEKQHYATPQEEQGDEIDDEYDYHDLRAEAAVHAKLRAEAFQKAVDARGRKQGELAVMYAQQGHMHTEKMHEANRRAAEMTFKMKNRGRPEDTLDLHCLHVDEALGALAEKLNYAKPGSHLNVITGKGNHSKGTAKIKPAVINYLKRQKIKFEEINAGLLKVQVSSPN